QPPERYQPARVAGRLPEGVLARCRRKHRERRYRCSLLTGGADAHVSTLGGRDHQDRGGVKALLTEMPREGRRRRRGLPLPDLCDAQGETTARPGWLGPGLLTRAAAHVLIVHPVSSFHAAAPGCVVPCDHRRARCTGMPCFGRRVTSPHGSTG